MAAETGIEVPRPFAAPGARGWTLLSLAMAGVLAAIHLGLDPRDLVPSEGGRQVAAELFGHALRPALHYQDRDVPETAIPLPLKALAAAHTTVLFAGAAMTLALAGGLVLGFFASTAWWADHDDRRSLWLPALYFATRALIGFLRSIHELLWAVLFLAAFGLGHLTAVLAIALPYAGTLAKVFSEMVDEAPREAASTLRQAGATSLQVFLFGLVPRALPDLTAYACYRFECALRSSAILGFFGFPTLGYYLAASFENLHYGEVWTYLYTLVLLVVLADLWSGAVRRRLVA